MVASTGIAATLLEGGMTAHRKFMLPNNMKHDQLSTVLLAIFISRNFQRKIILEKKYANSSQMELQHVPAKQLKTAQVIVFDEATMADKNVWNAIDKLLQKIMKNTLPFGGKVMIAGQFPRFSLNFEMTFTGGDWKQLLPVVPGESNDAAVDHSLLASPLWEHFKVR